MGICVCDWILFIDYFSLNYCCMRMNGTVSEICLFVWTIKCRYVKGTLMPPGTDSHITRIFAPSDLSFSVFTKLGGSRFHCVYISDKLSILRKLTHVEFCDTKGTLRTNI
jgi:hypothetical protein